MGCIDPGELQAFVAGTLDPAGGERVEAHIDECATCRGALSELARVIATGGVPPPDPSPGVPLRGTGERSGKPSLPRGAETDETLPAGANAATIAPIRPSPDSKVVPGATVDRFVVLRLLGRGGMGVVVLARDPELRRKVVIKLVRPEIVDPGDTQGTRVRLLREAQAMAQVSHPNVVPVYDVGTHAGQVFIAMEFIDGHNLAEWLAAARRSVAEILDCFLAAGRGLAAAHAAGLIHRDFKPQNVMIGRGGAVKVTDFGLARAELPTRREGARLSRERRAVAPSGALIDSPLTRTGALIGTPAYMAPEQMLGDFVDQRSDQFSFCVALWQALYGVRPFPGDSVTEILEATLQRKLADPSRAPRLPRRLRDALLRGLSAEPEERFESMEALLAELTPAGARLPWLVAGGVAATAAVVAIALAATRTDAPVAAAPVSAVCTGSDRELAQVWNAERRDKLIRTIAATGIAKADRIAAELSGSLDDYVAKWAAMHRENCEATRVRKQQPEAMMAQRSACLDRRRVDLRIAAEFALALHDVESMKLAKDQVAALPQIAICTAERLDEELILPTDQSAQTLVVIQRAQLTQADFFASQHKLDRAESIAREVVDQARKIPYAPLEAEGLIKLGQIQMYRLQWEEARTTMTEAVQLADMARHHRAKGQAQLALIQILRRLGRADEAERYRRYAQSSLSAAGSMDQAEIEMAASLAQSFLHQGEVDEAVAQHRRIIELTESKHGRDSVQTAKALGELAAVLMNSAERYGDALPLLDRAIAIHDAQTGIAQLEGLTTRIQKQVALHYTGRFADSIAVGDDLTARAGADSLWATAALSFRAMSQAELGDFEAAHASADRAIELEAKQMGKGSMPYAATYMLRAQLYQRAEDYAAAERVLRDARAMMAKLVPADDSHLTTADNAIASMVVKQGRETEAIRMFETTLATLQRQPDPDVPEIARTYSRLANALVAAGEHARAIEAASQSLERWKNSLAPAGEIASAKFTLARALWLANQDRARARTLAQEARAAYATTIEKRRLGEVDRWLAEHR